MNRDEGNAILALKNAWQGAIKACDELRELAPKVADLPADTAMKDLDFETYHRLSMAQAIAAMALRGLVEELQAKAAQA